MAINPPPIVVLVTPQMGENIGMCARAMLNCGLERLRLVSPRDGWPNKAAKAAAADADIVIENAEVFSNLDEALTDCHQVVATSARTRSLSTPVWEAGEASSRISEWSSAEEQVAVLFGPEASGLDNDSLSRANALMKFPTNPEFSSLNLAQSVLLFGWEWRKQNNRASEIPSARTATRAELQNFLARLEQELEAGQFFPTPEQKPHALQLVRTFFSKANPTEQELKMLHGIVTALRKSSD